MTGPRRRRGGICTSQGFPGLPYCIKNEQEREGENQVTLCNINISDLKYIIKMQRQDLGIHSEINLSIYQSTKTARHERLLEFVLK